MKLNKKGKLASFYKWTFGATEEELPKSLCPYFWKMLVAIVILPVTIASYLWGYTIVHNWWNDEYDYTNNRYFNYNKRSHLVWKRFFTGLFVWLLLAIVAKLISLALLLPFSMSGILFTIMWTILIILGIIVVLAVIVGIVMGYLWTKEKVENSEVIHETKNMITERFHSLKENYCPKIDWSE